MTGSHVTPCGLPGVGPIPVGLHSCHFYRDRQQLVEALVPFTLAGLRAKERCLLIASPPLPAKELMHELIRSGDDVEEALHSGALRVVDFDRWYLGAQGLKNDDLVQIWLQEERQALVDGYSGLRVSGNISFLTAEQWPAFMAYERSVSANFSDRRIVALCSYVLGNCIGDRKEQVIHAHACAFEQCGQDWQVVGNGQSFSE